MDYNNKRVYDDRTNQTLFTGTSKECVRFIQSYLFDHPNDDQYLWIGNANGR